MLKSIYLSTSIFLCLIVISANSFSDLKNPLVHWALDGDGRDSVGSSDLFIEGGDFEEGKFGQALSLDGSGAHAVDEDGAEYMNGLDNITIAMWVKSNQINTDKGFFICVDPEGSDRYMCIRYDLSGSNGGGTNIIKAGVNTDQGKTAFESSNDAQTTDWQHVAMAWESGADMKLYINGAEDVATNVEAAVGGELAALTKVIIGKGAKDQGGGWDGLIDDVYIYPEALSADDIAMVMEGKALSVKSTGKLVTLWGHIRESN